MKNCLISNLRPPRHAARLPVFRLLAKRCARRSFARALVLRRTLREAVERILAHRSVPKSAIAAIRDVLGKLAARRWELTRTETGFVRKFRPRFDHPDQFLGSSAARWLSPNRPLGSSIRSPPNNGANSRSLEVWDASGRLTGVDGASISAIKPERGTARR
jgi:hypothetical protein